MTIAVKNTQFNFRTNAELLAKAKEVVAAKNQDMTAILNQFLETVVAKNEIPVEDTDEVIFTELQAEIQKGYQSFLTERQYTLSDMRKEFGIEN
ncbi:MAG: hypothetical protein LBS41_03520 [Streptococcaceae bacterium]|jgi:antitoxin component of RelBE/YafQ-DinJ toxin-antitoxin module|nr:hypothetical protein [Streptococcaceae bacterium]